MSRGEREVEDGADTPLPAARTLRQRIGRGLLRLFGWSVEERLPPVPRYVCIGAPHTTNWDLPVGLAAMLALGIPPRWVGKHTLFRGPLGPVMRALGGVPVNRRVSQDFVSQVVERFREAEERGEPFVLVIAPEGTRSHTERWKTGFYHIARQADVPIALGYADYPSRRTGVGGWIEPGGDLEADMEADMEEIRAFYEGKRGRRPGKQGPVRASAETGG